MDSSTQNLTQRPTTTAKNGDVPAPPQRRERRPKGRAITKRGVFSLALSTLVPAALVILAMYVGSTNTCAKTTTSKTPSWFPPPWALHAGSAASAVLMGLSAWLVWAEGGFHASPVALSLYLAQFGLGLLWDPVVLGAGSGRVGLVLSMGMFGSLVGCYQAFKKVNPLAAQVVKPCLCWTAFLALVNLTLVYL